MAGWNRRLLRVDLTKGKTVAQKYSREFAEKFIGGRGFATKILWDELKPGIDPFSSKNLLIIAAGPLTGLPLPSSGKLVVASKSPLTGGYGDGNIGSRAAVNLRKAGYDGLVLMGKAKSPSYLLVEDDKTEIRKAGDLWGLDCFEAEKQLQEMFGKRVGILLIGPSGENLVRFATIISQRGRAGGRPGIGAIMGSKNLKAIVVHGAKEIPVADEGKLRSLAKDAYRSILDSDNYDFWIRQGTLAVLEWCNENSTLPTYNFREGVFEDADALSGATMEKLKTSQRGCPNCNMTCGNIIDDFEGKKSELDYENIAMLGSNIGLGNLKKVATLNRMADEMGLDAISLGSSIAFAMEASEKGLIDKNVTWGDYEDAKALVEDITYRRGIGDLLAEGVKRAAEKIGGESAKWAMQVKGLEISAYDCHLCPGMALSYGTSPIGAHHKDAWVISWEVSSGMRREYNEAKADKVIEFQRIRGGMFESLVVCRLPWIELAFGLEWYPKFIHAATGVKISLEEFYTAGDRFYSLIRSFWAREFGAEWSRLMDHPPARWFDEPTSKGPLKGSVLNRNKYDSLLQVYYRKRGWDNRGLPTKKTMQRLGLSEEAKRLENYVKLT
ncbi:MAG: aldehyde ferredoxin oxidoreductase family protein [Thermoproteota archaeon]|nr:aldehyde ferredoxin oxidoreductase family protein [Thermoproteota archaeon]